MGLAWDEGDCGQRSSCSHAGTGNSVGMGTELACGQGSGGEETDRVSEDPADIIFTRSAGASF